MGLIRWLIRVLNRYQKGGAISAKHRSSAVLRDFVHPWQQSCYIDLSRKTKRTEKALLLGPIYKQLHIDKLAQHCSCVLHSDDRAVHILRGGSQLRVALQHCQNRFAQTTKLACQILTHLSLPRQLLSSYQCRHHLKPQPMSVLISDLRKSDIEVASWSS